MSVISPLSLLLMGCGAVLLTLVLSNFYRLYRLNYLRLWSQSWLALSVHFFSGLLLISISAGEPLPPALLRLFLSLICYFAAFAHIVWLLCGTYELASGRLVSRRGQSAALFAALILTLAVILPYAFAPGMGAAEVRIRFRLGVRDFINGVAFASAGYWLLYLWPRRRSFGLRLTGWAFALYGGHYLFYSLILVVPWPRIILSNYAGIFEVIAHSAIGLGLVSWFFEEERDKALAASNALGASHTRIRDLAGKLIVAQEEERKYIARELHDDFNQQVASLAIGLGKLESQLADASEPVRRQVEKLEARTTQLCDRIRRLSHELHSSTLEHVGLGPALKLYCAELSENEEVAVSFTAAEDLGAVPADAAQCLYRVAQESLRNFVKHSGASSAEVKLSRSNGSVELRVTDAGRGFERETVTARRGLGLVSMEERIRLLDGSLQINTHPARGTELIARVPVVV